MYVGYVARKKKLQRKTTNLFLLLEEENLKFVWQFLQQQKKTLKIYAVEACCVQHDCMILSVRHVCLSVFEHFQSVGDVKPKETDEQSDGRTDGQLFELPLLTDVIFHLSIFVV